MIDLTNYLDFGEKWLNDVLSAEKQETFAPDYRLNIFYVQDQFDNDTAIGKSLLKLQEYLLINKIPNFFVNIHTNKPDIELDLISVRDFFAGTDVPISHQSISGEFKKIMLKRDSICILPWMHIFIDPNGTVGPCCHYNELHPLGHLSNDQLKTIINGDKLKTIRRQMLDNQRPSSCSRCYKKEDNLQTSGRLLSNKIFKKYFNLTKQTEPDGTFNDFKLHYLDFRASNVCNLKCRMCGSKFSSRIAEEDAVLFSDRDKSYINLKLQPDQINNTLDYIEQNILDLDTVYFAGGEPMVMKEHYKILDLLLKYKKNDVQLYYNTNLTTLKYKNLDVLDYWKQFTDVRVGASIDLIGAQAEYVRHGTIYSELEENYLKIKDSVKFTITSIVTLYNIFNLPKLQKHWIEKFNLPPSALEMHVVIDFPDLTNCQILPNHYKNLASISIIDHTNWLTSIKGSEELVNTWQDVLYFINNEDHSYQLESFFQITDLRDKYRNERFEDVFPEYRDLRSYV